MKYQIKKMIIRILYCLFTAFLFLPLKAGGKNKKQSSTERKNEPSLTHLLKDISGLDRQEAANVFESVQEATTRLEKAVEKSTKDLQKTVDRKIERLESVAREESEKIAQRCAQEAEMLQQESHKQSIKLKQQAAETILQLVVKAEEEALRAKLKTRQEFMKQKIDAFAKGTAAPKESLGWKDALHKEFFDALRYLQGIIVQGESSSEVHEFEERFKEQESWFEKTLESTQDPSDESYYRLSEKKTALANITDAIKSAERLIERHFSHLPQESSFYRQLRLALLYEINAVMQKKSGNGAMAIAATTLSDNDIVNIFNNVLHSLQTKQQKMPPKDPSAETAALIAQSTAQQIKYAIAPQLELLNKDHLELCSIIMDSSQKFDHFREEEIKSNQATARRIDNTEKGISDIKNILTQQTHFQVDLLHRSQLAEELTEKKISDSMHRLDTIKTLMQEQVQQHGQSLEKISSDQQAWIDQLSNKPQQTENMTPTILPEDQERTNRLALENELLERIRLEKK